MYNTINICYLRTYYIGMRSNGGTRQSRGHGLWDLFVVGALIVGINLVVFVPTLDAVPLRVVFGIAFLLFLPGYAFVAALFPESSTVETGPRDQRFLGLADAGPAITGVERVFLSVVTSIVIVPLLGYILTFTSYGLHLPAVVVLVCVVTGLLLALALWRRLLLAPADRFVVPFPRVWPSRSWMRTANLFLVVGLIVAFAGLGYALTAPTSTMDPEFYLVTEGEDGEYVASGYPERFSLDEPRPLTVAVANHDSTATSYTVVVLLQRVRSTDTGYKVVEEAEQARFTVDVPANTVRYRQHDIAPTMRGTELRLTYLLYAGEPPEHPGPETAIYDLYIWIDVAGPDAGSRTAPTSSP